MAFSMNSSSGLGRGRFRGSPALAEINIVPLVDVVLVLLIIFMLTAHVMEFGLQVEVPKVKPVKENVQDLPVVSISREGTSYLNEKPVNINLLAGEIQALPQRDCGLCACRPPRFGGFVLPSRRHARRSQAGGQCCNTTG